MKTIPFEAEAQSGAAHSRHCHRGSSGCQAVVWLSGCRRANRVQTQPGEQGAPLLAHLASVTHIEDGIGKVAAVPSVMESLFIDGVDEK